MKTTTITTSFISAACFFCAGNTIVHDTGIDVAAQRVVAFGNHQNELPSTIIRKPHTHSERSSFYQAIRDRQMADVWSVNDV